jgi:glycosyltransferase involved in cell wall biosynthesis
MRVAYVSNGEFYAGAERVQDILASELAALGCEVTFVLLKPVLFDRVRKSRRAPVIKLPMARRTDMSVVSKLASILKQGSFDLVHSHEPRSLLVAALAARRCGTPLIYHVHSQATKETEVLWRNAINSAIERMLLAEARAVICVAEYLTPRFAWIKRRPARLHVVRNGVECCAYRRARPPPVGGEWTLGIVALFRPLKGLETLLLSLAELRSRGYPIRLKAIGAFETRRYQRRVESLARNLCVHTCVEWAGFKSDARAELQTFDLFVLPSVRSEGAPLAILEAMAASVPVVATRVGGIPELIRNGVDGVLVDPDDPGQLADGIAQFLDRRLDWNQVRLSALSRQQDEFSAEIMAKRIHGIYEGCLR